jgi:hypothetical protein
MERRPIQEEFNRVTTIKNEAQTAKDNAAAAMVTA